MAVIAAAVLAALLAGGGASSDAGPADAGAPAAGAGDAGVADGGPTLDPADEDLVRHLDEIERQELLEQLELFEEPDG